MENINLYFKQNIDEYDESSLVYQSKPIFQFNAEKVIITYALNNHRFMLDQSIFKSPTANISLHVLPGLTLKNTAKAHNAGPTWMRFLRFPTSCSFTERYKLYL